MKNKKKRHERARADEDALAARRARPASALGDVASDSEDETVERRAFREATTRERRPGHGTTSRRARPRERRRERW